MSKEEQKNHCLPAKIQEDRLSVDTKIFKHGRGVEIRLTDEKQRKSSLKANLERESNVSEFSRFSHSYSQAVASSETIITARKWNKMAKNSPSSLSQVAKRFYEEQEPILEINSHFRTISSLTISSGFSVKAIGWNYQTVEKFSSEKVKLATVNADGTLKIYEPKLQQRGSWTPLVEEKIECENDNVVEFDLSGSLVASAGSTSDIIVQNLQDMQYPLTLVGHDSPCTDLRFPEQDKLLSSSRDSNVFLWDIHKERVETDFREHSAIVNALDVNPINAELFATGGSDLRTKFWDRRTSKSVSTWLENTNEVTGVQYFRNGYNLITSSQDCTCNLLCLRSNKVLQVYEDGRCTGGFSSVQLSRSGRYLFATHYQELLVFDVLTAKVLDILDLGSKITCIKLSPDYMALACSLNSGSIDFVGLG